MTGNLINSERADNQTKDESVKGYLALLKQISFWQDVVFAISTVLTVILPIVVFNYFLRASSEKSLSSLFKEDYILYIQLASVLLGIALGLLWFYLMGKANNRRREKELERLREYERKFFERVEKEIIPHAVEKAR